VRAGGCLPVLHAQPPQAKRTATPKFELATTTDVARFSHSSGIALHQASWQHTTAGWLMPSAGWCCKLQTATNAKDQPPECNMKSKLSREASFKLAPGASLSHEASFKSDPINMNHKYRPSAQSLLGHKYCIVRSTECPIATRPRDCN